MNTANPVCNKCGCPLSASRIMPVCFGAIGAVAGYYIGMYAEPMMPLNPYLMILILNRYLSSAIVGFLGYRFGSCIRRCDRCGALIWTNQVSL